MRAASRCERGDGAVRATPASALSTPLAALHTVLRTARRSGICVEWRRIRRLPLWGSHLFRPAPHSHMLPNCKLVLRGQGAVRSPPLVVLVIRWDGEHRLISLPEGRKDDAPTTVHHQGVPQGVHTHGCVARVLHMKEGSPCVYVSANRIRSTSR